MDMQGQFKQADDGDLNYYPDTLGRSYTRFHAEWARSGGHGLYLRIDSRGSLSATTWEASSSVIVRAADTSKLLKKLKKLDQRTTYPHKCDACGGKGVL